MNALSNPYRVVAVGEAGFTKTHYVSIARGMGFAKAIALCGTEPYGDWHERQAKSSTPVCNSCNARASQLKATIVRSKDDI